MESLDKVISMYNGIWPKFDWDSNDNNKNAIVETIKVWYHDGEDKYHEVGEISKGGTAVDRAYCKVICTKEQFEQRVNQLKGEQTMTNWYDYNNQEMVFLPPVGEIVFTCNSEDEVIKVKILEHTYNGVSNIAVCRVINDNINPNLGTLGYYQHFYPLDWEKKKEKKELVTRSANELVVFNAVLGLKLSKTDFRDITEYLYDQGYLKFPEDK